MTLPREVLTPAEAARRLPFSLSTLYRKIERGEVDVLRLAPDQFWLDPAALRRAFGTKFRYTAPRGYQQV